MGHVNSRTEQSDLVPSINFSYAMMYNVHCTCLVHGQFIEVSSTLKAVSILVPGKQHSIHTVIYRLHILVKCLKHIIGSV